VGYRPKREPFKLDFSGTEHDGLEVIVRPLPTSVVLDIVAATARKDDPTVLRQVYATFAYALESWNVEGDDGEPVPADLDGLLSQEPRFIITVITAWAAKMAGGS
jgi:hypothetical protein